MFVAGDNEKCAYWSWNLQLVKSG